MLCRERQQRRDGILDRLSNRQVDFEACLLCRLYADNGLYPVAVENVTGGLEHVTQRQKRWRQVADVDFAVVDGRSTEDDFEISFTHEAHHNHTAR
ncbi:hypothetical protein D9M70_601570 [compost metagenome]